MSSAKHRSWRDSQPGSRPRCGLTLMEVVISSLFVGMLIVAALGVSESVFRMRLSASEFNDGHLLAEELMTEILQSAYRDPTGGAGLAGSFLTRAGFNDLDDYDGWTASPPQQKDGTPVPNTGGWRRSVTVEWVQPGDPNAASATDLGLKRITVTVAAPSGRTWTMAGLRAERGQLELDPPVNTTYITHGTITLQPDGGTSRSAGTAISNHAKDDK